MKKLKLLLLFGGESPEHEVSLTSAKNVYTAIDKRKYAIILCYIDTKGIWYIVDGVRKARSRDPKLRAALGEKKFYAGTKEIKPDVILPILHGQNGEDGTVQGLAKLLHIPIAGPSLVSSVVTMDKDITKKQLTAANLPVVDWIAVHGESNRPAYKDVAKNLGETLFLKPAHAGSSIGVSKVSSLAEYNAAMHLAFSYDKKVIIESAILEAREIEVAVIGNRQSEATVPGEIIPSEEFYSHDDKYGSASLALVKIPAELDDFTEESIRKMALHAYRAIEGHGMARIDFFLTKDGQIYINEINTIPGFTNVSMYPKLWQYMGLEYSKLIDRLIQFALEK